MTLALKISERAELDLASQYRWYAKNAGPELAESFLAAFDTRARRLAEQPGLGRTRSFRAPELTGMRSLAVSRRFSDHLIFYRIDAEDLLIERVMHGARDLPRRLLDPTDDS